MKQISYTLKRKNVIISLFDNTEILYNQLDDIGIIERVKSVPQLGCIHVIKANNQSKYNYLMTQLYLLGIISGDKMRSKLEISTNNTLKTIQNINFTIGETLQMLVILNSIGHFDTTFVSSKAMIKLCNEDEDFKNTFLRSIADETTKCIAIAAIEENDYMHFHLINALIILEHMEQTNQVKFVTELLYNYL